MVGRDIGAVDNPTRQNTTLRRRIRIANVVGARPNFVKIAPLMAAYDQTELFDPLLVHTGQHYDEALSDLFFRDLSIPHPHFNLGVGSGSHAAQTAAIMKLFEPVLLEHQPDAVLVVGDVNSTIACGLVAVKLGVPLIHVEAGLRSGDRTMPEEINRIVTDAISDILFCTEQEAVENLAREGIPKEQVFLVGNVMADTLLANRKRAEDSKILDRLELQPMDYAVATLHRPSNVDNEKVLSGIMDALDQIQRELPIVLPMHPRLTEMLNQHGLQEKVKAMDRLMITDPLGYLDFLKLLNNSCIAFTDSGGVQEETTVLGIPCLTLRDSTERPVTITTGTNRLVGISTEEIVSGFRHAMGSPPLNKIPDLWDGMSAKRIVEILAQELRRA